MYLCIYVCTYDTYQFAWGVPILCWSFWELNPATNETTILSHYSRQSSKVFRGPIEQLRKKKKKKTVVLMFCLLERLWHVISPPRTGASMIGHYDKPHHDPAPILYPQQNQEPPIYKSISYIKSIRHSHGKTPMKSNEDIEKTRVFNTSRVSGCKNSPFSTSSFLNPVTTNQLPLTTVPCFPVAPSLAEWLPARRPCPGEKRCVTVVQCEHHMLETLKCLKIMGDPYSWFIVKPI